MSSGKQTGGSGGMGAGGLGAGGMGGGGVTCTAKKICVLGASGNVGRAVCDVLSRRCPESCEVVFVTRNPDRLQTTLSKCGKNRKALKGDSEFLLW